MPRPIGPALEPYITKGFTPPNEMFWMAVAFPFVLVTLFNDSWELFHKKDNEETDVAIGKMACVVTIMLVAMLGAFDVTPRVPTLIVLAAYLALTGGIGLALASSEARTQTATRAARRQMFEHGRVIDLTIDSVRPIDIGGVRVRGKLGDRTLTVDVPEDLKSRVAPGGTIEVFEPPPPEDGANPDADVPVYATALLPTFASAPPAA